MNWRLYLKHRKNKILAVSLSTIAFLMLASSFALEVSLVGASFTSLWNYLLYFLSYGMILFYNIRNDNNAYRGITLFVFFMAFDQIWSVFMGGIDLAVLFNMANPLSIVINVFYLALVLTGGVIGFMLYAKIARYMVDPLASFRKVRIFAIVYAAILLVLFGLSLWSIFFFLGDVGSLALASLILLPLSEVIMAVAIIFTLERLRRI